MTADEIRAKIAELKRERDHYKVIAESLKISSNGCYGKLGSAFSILYAPHLLIATTLTGQLSILMLIERAELGGIEVISANTDGVVFFVRRDREDDFRRIVTEWETATGFTMEETRYASLYASSVNTYLAIREDGKAKRKGPIADPWAEGDVREQMKKNPMMTICSDAVLKYLKDGVAIEDTVYACRDPRAFVTVVKAKAGATWRGHYLGRAIRYYWSLDGDPILTGKNAGRVARTEGARPLQELTDEVPADVDRLRYCEEAASILVDLGVRM